MGRRKPNKRPRSPFKNERSADLQLWIGDGCAGGANARFAADVEVSIGRTNSKRAMGFVVNASGNPYQSLNPGGENKQMSFVLDRDQVWELIGYLHMQLSGLRKPLGRGESSYMFSWILDPRLRLQRKLEDAAMKAHPGWKQITKQDERDQTWGEIGDWVQEPGAPDIGPGLVKWFKRVHPRKAARVVEREFTRRLWAGLL